ncbi:MAG: SpoIIIAH-like family protein [Firmicutes bacterium]|nr:SpoIIIAH-like family protein [Bacillota bacterium]
MRLENQRKLLLILVLLVAVVALWYVKQNREGRIIIGKPPVAPAEGADREETDVLDGGETQNRDAAGEEVAGEEAAAGSGLDPENWDLESSRDFFVEYRLQRDRVRASEIEMLERMIENPNISPEGKKKAEAQLLALTAAMEEELLVENMLKAQGYKEAIIFKKDGQASVVVQAVKLNEEQFLQIAETVSNATGVRMENIAVLEHGGIPDKE